MLNAKALAVGLQSRSEADGAATAAFNKLAVAAAAAKKAMEDTCKKDLGLVETANLYVTQNMGGFIQEPGYDMNVYSGEDQVSYLQPAPIQTAQSGIAQLDAAIARAARLEPHDKLQEGIDDLTEVAIILATPKTARMAEQSGIAVSLGKSRMNPGAEILALEVEGANGPWPISPARQHSVPQGALNHAKIGHASDVDVSSTGLFTRGAFQPIFSR